MRPLACLSISGGRSPVPGDTHANNGYVLDVITLRHDVNGGVKLKMILRMFIIIFIS